MTERSVTGDQFVVLWHQIDREHTFERASHFDLMIEWGDSLRTWAVDRWPLTPGETCTASPLANHRLAYLNYEGPVSGNRGLVSRVATGSFRIIDETDGLLRLGLKLENEELNVLIVDNKLTVVN
jgi:hypothetical protein